jgi:hypothetical protein
VFPKGNLKIGDFVTLQIASCNGATLFGKEVEASAVI